MQAITRFFNRLTYRLNPGNAIADVVAEALCEAAAEVGQELGGQQGKALGPRPLVT